MMRQTGDGPFSTGRRKIRAHFERGSR
jgi:hypothetical protein